MTLKEFKTAITAKFACAEPTNVTTAELDAIIDQVVENCKTVNPDATRPVVRG